MTGQHFHIMGLKSAKRHGARKQCKSVVKANFGRENKERLGLNLQTAIRHSLDATDLLMLDPANLF